MTGELALEIQNLNVSFRDRLVLEDINLSLNQGEFLGLIGPNGAGKTVLLKTILGLIPSERGTIRVLGNTDPRGLIGYVPQYARFDFDFPINVRDVVLMGRLAGSNIFGGYSKHDFSIVKSVLELLELSQLEETHIGKLSGGQLQRLLIARALALQPKVLLLDEPTASLDSKMGKSVYEILDNLSSSMTIILVSHDLGVIAQHVKTIACLNKRLHYHHSKELGPKILQEIYGCPIDLLAHGHAHRVLSEHGD